MLIFRHNPMWGWRVVLSLVLMRSLSLCADAFTSGLGDDVQIATNMPEGNAAGKLPLYRLKKCRSITGSHNR